VRSLPDVFTLHADEEATRLWQGAQEAYAEAGDRLVALSQCIDLGVRAAELRAIARLREVGEALPQRVRHGLEHEDARIHWYRDALPPEPCFDLRVLLDLVSRPELDCIAPELHGGLGASHFPCERARASAHAALGFSLRGEDRDLLLLLLAYRNRLFRCPPPVEVRKEEVLVAFPALTQLMGSLEGAPSAQA